MSNEAQKDLMRLNRELQHAREIASKLRKELASAFVEIERLKDVLSAKATKPKAPP